MVMWKKTRLRSQQRGGTLCAFAADAVRPVFDRERKPASVRRACVLNRGDAADAACVHVCARRCSPIAYSSQILVCSSTSGVSWNLLCARCELVFAPGRADMSVRYRGSCCRANFAQVHGGA